MKKSKIILFSLIALTLSFVAGIAMYGTMSEIRISDYLIYGAIGFVALFGIVNVLKRMKEEKKGIVAEDELSMKIKQKAAAQSFMVSFYIWTLILLFTIDTNISHETIIGIGIAAMSLAFIGYWAYYNNQGISNDHSH